jgi:hypothetical protein
MWMIRRLTHGSSFGAIFDGKDTRNRGAGSSGSFGQWMKSPRQVDTLYLRKALGSMVAEALLQGMFISVFI